MQQTSTVKLLAFFLRFQTKERVLRVKYGQALKKDGISEYLRISVSYLIKCICKNVRSILEVNRLVPPRMENYIKELSVL